MYSHYPNPIDYDTEEEYLDAVDAYERAESEYIDSYVEREKFERHGID